MAACSATVSALGVMVSLPERSTKVLRPATLLVTFSTFSVLYRYSPASLSSPTALPTLAVTLATPTPLSAAPVTVLLAVPYTLLESATRT